MNPVSTVKFLALLLGFGDGPLTRLNDRLAAKGYPPFWKGGLDFNDDYRPSEWPGLSYWPPSTWPKGRLRSVYLYYIPDEPPAPSDDPTAPPLKWVQSGQEPNKPEHEIVIDMR